MLDWFLYFLPVVLRVYSDQATTGTASSPARPAASCALLAGVLAAACCWSWKACIAPHKLTVVIMIITVKTFIIIIIIVTIITVKFIILFVIIVIVTVTKLSSIG